MYFFYAHRYTSWCTSQQLLYYRPFVTTAMLSRNDKKNTNSANDEARFLFRSTLNNHRVLLWMGILKSLDELTALLFNFRVLSNFLIVGHAICSQALVRIWVKLKTTVLSNFLSFCLVHRWVAVNFVFLLLWL